MSSSFQVSRMDSMPFNNACILISVPDAGAGTVTNVSPFADGGPIKSFGRAVTRKRIKGLEYD